LQKWQGDNNFVLSCGGGGGGPPLVDMSVVMVVITACGPSLLDNVSATLFLTLFCIQLHHPALITCTTPCVAYKKKL
jgi:hypothetical protein